MTLRIGYKDLNYTRESLEKQGLKVCFYSRIKFRSRINFCKFVGFLFFGVIHGKKLKKKINSKFLKKFGKFQIFFITLQFHGAKFSRSIPLPHYLHQSSLQSKSSNLSIIDFSETINSFSFVYRIPLIGLQRNVMYVDVCVWNGTS